MNILAIETTASEASAAVTDLEEKVHVFRTDGNMMHLQNLIPLIDEALKESGMKLSDIEGIAVSRGPGSFTGIRIGVSTAKALAQVLGVGIAEVPTLKAMSLKCRDYKGIVCPVLDARRGQVYSAAYVFGEDGAAEELLPEGAYDIGQVTDTVFRGENVLFIGDGVTNEPIIGRIREAAGEKGQSFDVEESQMQDAGTTALLGLEIFKAGKAVSYVEAEPEYLRKSEAERNLELKKAKEARIGEEGR